ncbi:MAG: signal recognition particle-docking protein FtsY [Acidimicrobiia bacterium]|nr:signal recognition particle-docking protein FtsY [Acidimicrobiia bacterium]
MEILLLVVAVAVVAGAVLGFVALRRRGEAADLEPPAAPTLEAPPADERVAEAEPPPVVEAPPAEEAPPTVEAPPEPVLEPEVEAPPEPVVEPEVKPRFRDRLSRARETLTGYVGSVLSRAGIDDETWDELEEALIRADVGVSTSTEVIEEVRGRVDDQGITEPSGALDVLKSVLKERLAVESRALATADAKPTIWLFVGVNGVGKTTTIGKLGRREVDDGRSVVMAAGDTFRAAAVEQLEAWAGRAGAAFVHGDEGADPSSVVFDAVESAAAKGADLVLADTAGRLHTKVNLMEEARKVRRVAEKGEGRVAEVLLVLDATTGQNGLVQAQQFTEAVDVTGVVLTKLDGSAKGGIVFAIQSDLGIPVKLVGLGEGVADLVEFDPDEFVDALFD